MLEKGNPMPVYQLVDQSSALAFGPFQAGDSGPPVGASGTQTSTTPGAGTFTWPSDIGSVLVECWGGGGGGGGAATGERSGGGGGGGYSRAIVQGVPGTAYPYTVGAGGTGGAGGGAGALGVAGGDTTYRTSVVVAKGGGVGATYDAGGTGGQASAGTGTTKYNGGNGAAKDTHGGGGGSSAGTGSNGNNGTTAGVPGAAPTGGVIGGVGDTSPGGAGAAGGGGGGGCDDDAAAGGAGGVGKIKFTWPPA